jgi:hypothetical protein
MTARRRDRGRAALPRGAVNVATFADGSDDDRAWFARHPARRHRLRHPIGCELELARTGLPAHVISLMAVHQIREGERVRIPIGADRIEPAQLNSEIVAADAFKHALAHARGQGEVDRMAALGEVARRSA